MNEFGHPRSPQKLAFKQPSRDWEILGTTFPLRGRYRLQPAGLPRLAALTRAHRARAAAAILARPAALIRRRFFLGLGVPARPVLCCPPRMEENLSSSFAIFSRIFNARLSSRTDKVAMVLEFMLAKLAIDWPESKQNSP